MSLGEQIKKRRNELNITQEQLAERLFVSRSTVSNWEINRNYPDIKLLISLSEVLDISLDDLLKENNTVVESIAYDSSLKKKNQKSARIMKAVIATLCAVIVIILFLFNKDADLNANQIAGVSIENDELVIEMDLPFYRTAESYYIELNNDNSADISIGLMISLKHNNYIRIPLDELEHVQRITINSSDGAKKEYYLKDIRQ